MNLQARKPDFYGVNTTHQPMPRWLSQLYTTLFLLLPWSVELPVGAWKLTAPTEPLLALAGIGLLAVVLRRMPKPPRWLVIFCLIWVSWQVLAAAKSVMPLVSFKYTVVETGHWWVFFVGAWLWPFEGLRWLRCFAFSAGGVILYTILHHAGFHFRINQAVLAPMPFFPDHTMYAAVLAMLLPWVMFEYWQRHSNWLLAAAAWLLSGLALSFCRAAWLSVLMAGFVATVLLWKQKWLLLMASVVLLGVGIIFQEKIIHKLGHDVSSLERLNRFDCAWRMSAEKPLTGFGPGTFQFQYLPFQRPENMTRISVKAAIVQRSPDNFGRGGGAHSEYLRFLSETGWPGLVLWMAWVCGTLFIGLKNHLRAQDSAEKWFYAALTLSLFTFFAHSLVNEFLHDARLAALLWVQAGMLVPRYAAFISRSSV